MRSSLTKAFTIRRRSTTPHRTYNEMLTQDPKEKTKRSHVSGTHVPHTQHHSKQTCEHDKHVRNVMGLGSTIAIHGALARTTIHCAAHPTRTAMNQWSSCSCDVKLRLWCRRQLHCKEQLAQILCRKTAAVVHARVCLLNAATEQVCLIPGHGVGCSRKDFHPIRVQPKLLPTTRRTKPHRWLAQPSRCLSSS